MDNAMEMARVIGDQRSRLDAALERIVKLERSMALRRATESRHIDLIEHLEQQLEERQAGNESIDRGLVKKLFQLEGRLDSLTGELDVFKGRTLKGFHDVDELLARRIDNLEAIDAKRREQDELLAATENDEQAQMDAWEPFCTGKGDPPEPWVVVNVAEQRAQAELAESIDRQHERAYMEMEYGNPDDTSDPEGLGQNRWWWKCAPEGAMPCHHEPGDFRPTRELDWDIPF